jgi:hypothetical protein
VVALLAAVTPASAQQGADLRVMSFNLKFASDTPPNSWPERRPVMRELLRDGKPQRLGTQEGLCQQLRDIQSDLPKHYDSIGQGRDGGSQTWGGYAVNTHFEAFDAVARDKSAQLLLARAAEDFDPALPVVATGDFNEAGRVGGTVYDRLVTNGPFDDTTPGVTTRRAEINTFHLDGQYPSDHLPVQAVVRLPN